MDMQNAQQNTDARTQSEIQARRVLCVFAAADGLEPTSHHQL